MPIPTPSEGLQTKHEDSGPCSHLDGSPHGKRTIAIGWERPTSPRSKLSARALGVRVAKGSAQGEGSNWNNSAFQMGRSGACRSSRWHDSEGVNERATLEVRA